MKGYFGKILNVDLSALRTSIEPLDWIDAKKFIGGSGLGARYLYDNTDDLTDPLGPENVLIFMTGPFVGTNVISSSRYSIVSKSPLTGIFAESSSGGDFGFSLKRCGFDGIVVKGKAPYPVYIYINNGNVELRNAQDIWGLDTLNTDTTLKERTDRKVSIACIGNAGENCVSLACVMNDGIAFRAAGRCGMGAVMGSKMLKAIVALGSIKVDIAHKDSLTKSIREVAGLVREKTQGLEKYGTPGAIATFEEMGTLPIQNWRYAGRWKDGAQKITGATLLEEYVTGNYSCRNCIIGCGKTVQVNNGPYKGIEQSSPEYETLALFGSNCLVDNLPAIIKANELCNRYGLDTMSTGSVIAFGMEAYEKGILNKRDIDGIDLKWGNVNAILKVIEKIAKNEGIGKILGNGVRKASKIIGNNSEEFAIHVKGLEYPAHDPRGYYGNSVAFGTSARGACHLSGFTHIFERTLSDPEMGIPEPMNRFETEGKGILTAKTQNYMGMLDSLIICKFVLFGGIGISKLIEWYQYVTGEELDAQEFNKIGERIFNIKRLYNIKCGISRKDDFPAFRTMTLKKHGDEQNPNPDLPHVGKMLEEYYKFRDWSEDGVPSPNKIQELGLGF